VGQKGWIGVDLDGTLAFYDHWRGPQIGTPVPKMVERVKALLTDGWEVRIFTARVCSGHSPNVRLRARLAIQEWCLEHIGQRLLVTSEKDPQMIMLYDDRCSRVVQNTGEIVGEDLR
jgi:hypothetical protein